VSLGERSSSHLFVGALRAARKQSNQNIKDKELRQPKLLDLRNVLIINEQFGKARLLVEGTAQRANILTNSQNMGSTILVTQGLIGSTSYGHADVTFYSNKCDHYDTEKS
jgi:aspartokinase